MASSETSTNYGRKDCSREQTGPACFLFNKRSMKGEEKALDRFPLAWACLMIQHMIPTQALQDFNGHLPGVEEAMVSRTPSLL